MGALARAALVAFAIVMLAAGARAQAVSAADQAEIHKVIQAELDAFKKGDFDRAYAVSAPSIKVLYPTVQAFTNMVKNRYSQLLAPKAIVFGTMAQTTVGPVQRVFVTAADGRPYIATYSLQQQPDKSWLIGGVTVARDGSSSGI